MMKATGFHAGYVQAFAKGMSSNGFFIKAWRNLSYSEAVESVKFFTLRHGFIWPKILNILLVAFVISGLVCFKARRAVLRVDDSSSFRSA
jgi:hypothetical protein